MECFTCKTRMVCVSDVNDASVRIDFLKCPKCSSVADVIYGEQGKYITEVYWRRDENGNN